MTYECSGCGRKNFLTSHGLAKHAAKCKRNPPRVFPSGAGAMRANRTPVVPAWEKIRGVEHDASDLVPGFSIVKSGPWTVYAYASDYNSRQRKNGQSYVSHGAGTFTGRDLLKHADAVVAHANKQGAERFLEFYKVSRQNDGSTLIVLLFGS